MSAAQQRRLVGAAVALGLACLAWRHACLPARVQMDAQVVRVEVADAGW